MNSIAGKKCVPCQVGAPLVSEEQMKVLIRQIPEWDVIEVNGINRLKRDFTFENFVEALEFTNKVGAIAENEGHHPEIVTGWGKVTVSWWTHKIGGLHENDFIMAAKTDELMGD